MLNDHIAVYIYRLTLCVTYRERETGSRIRFYKHKKEVNFS